MSVNHLSSITFSNEFLSAIAGAIIGGTFVLIGTLISAWCEHRRQEKNRQEILISTLQVISAELNTIFDRYNQTIGIKLEKLKPNSSLNYYYFVTEEYFTIFNGNAHLLGQLKDKELISSIIATYITLKEFVDSFRLNNAVLIRYNELRLIGRANSDNIIQDMIQNTLTALIDSGERLKLKHENLKINVPALLSKIQKNIKSNVI